MLNRVLFLFVILAFFVNPAIPSQTSSSAPAPLEMVRVPEDIDPSVPIFIADIELRGNEVTRERVIMREIQVSAGETITPEALVPLLERSRQNLLNTSLFNFVEVSLVFDEIPSQFIIRFTFVERWYLWPFPIFEIAERNFDDWYNNPSFRKINFGLYVVKENFRGRMERLRFLARGGYRQNYSLGYTIPYINTAQTIGMGFHLGYNRRREIVYKTVDNLQQFYSVDGSYALQQFYFSTQLFYRKGIYSRHNFQVDFNRFIIADSLLVLNPLFSPGAAANSPFLTLSYDFRNDHRDVKAYPLNGHYFDIRLRRQGLGLLKNELMDMTTAETSLRRFWQLSPSWYFSAGLNAKTSFGDFQPYFLQQGLGFRGDLVRGYENFVIDGQHFSVLKSNLKYQLLSPRSSRIGFIRNEKFSLIHYALYVNLFADMGYVNDKHYFVGNPYSNTLLAGYGIGFDLVTYYDKVLRTEFSLTRQGDRGFHLHLIAPI
jgi:outer membrane protein assembly factor BamA